MSSEIGWPEYVAQIAAIRDTLPPAERTHLAALAGNYGEAGALALYGPAHNLPMPISMTNSFYDRSFGPEPPPTIRASGLDVDWLTANFADCRIAARVSMPYGVHNDETDWNPEIAICHAPYLGWPTFWQTARRFG